METKLIRVPKTFGSIENISTTDTFTPWEAKGYTGTSSTGVPEYEPIGRFESFSEALLAVIIYNAMTKKNSLLSKLSDQDKEYIDAKVDEYYSDVRKRIIPYVKQKHRGPLVVRFKGIDDHLPEFPYDDMDPLDSPNIVYQQKPASYTRRDEQGHSNLISSDNDLFNYTVQDVFDHWYKDKSMEDITQHTMDGYLNSFRKIQHLANKRFLDLRFSDIDACVKHEKEIGNSFSMRKRMKLFFSQLFQWAIAHELCNYNLALNVKLGKNESDFHRKPFTLQQIATLFAHVDEDPFIEEILMLLFSGCRIREFLNIKREDIHMDQRYFVVTQSKTKAGRNRLVPIHKKMMKYYRKRLRAKSDFLIHDARGRQMEYEVWSKKFKNVMNRFGWTGLSCHSTRHTLISMLYSAGVNPVTARRMVGHVQADDVHDRVYVHVQLIDLLKAIDSI